MRASYSVALVEGLAAAIDPSLKRTARQIACGLAIAAGIIG